MEIVRDLNQYMVDFERFDDIDDALNHIRESFEPTPEPMEPEPIIAKTVLVDKKTGSVILASAGTAHRLLDRVMFSDGQFADGIDFDKAEIRKIKPTALLRGDVCPKAVEIVD